MCMCVCARASWVSGMVLDPASSALSLIDVSEGALQREVLISLASRGHSTYSLPLVAESFVPTAQIRNTVCIYRKRVPPFSDNKFPRARSSSMLKQDYIDV